jgi:predicted DNA-binding protein with PD1-like motif
VTRLPGYPVRMRVKRLQESPESVHVVVLDAGEEAVEAVGRLARELRLGAAQITAIGAFEQAVVGWFDREAGDYRRIPVREQCEVLSLVGDIAVGEDGEPAPHLHAVLGTADGQVRGGHLLEGRTWPTLELVVRNSPTALAKTWRPEVGLALIDPDKTAERP